MCMTLRIPYWQAHMYARVTPLKSLVLLQKSCKKKCDVLWSVRIIEQDFSPRFFFHHNKDIMGIHTIQRRLSLFII